MNVTPETDLLLACARRFACTASPAEFRDRAGRITDWPAAISLARAHWMEPLAAWYLDTECAELLPSAIREVLRAAIHRSAVNFLLLSAELIKVLCVLDAGGIRVVPLKGPVLAAMLCDENPWRESCDLDLLVRPADITWAKDALIAAGYRLDSQLPGGEENATFHWRSQLVLTRDGIGPSIDLHWQILPSLFPCARYFDSAWNRLETTVFHNQEIPAFSPEDQLFFLCAHAARHSWQSLRLAADVARLIHIRPNLDWDWLIRSARAADGTMVMALGLWMVSRLLNVELPAPVLEFVNATIGAKVFAQRLLERLLSTPDENENFSDFGLQFKLAAGWWPKLQCTAAYALLPTDADGASLRLPRWLYLLYYPYRPARLAVKHGNKLLKSIRGGFPRPNHAAGA
ncbi:MAG TPA: nucleotidyltransferase family protein [Candidatus Binataceae bacterium]|nr:nucleotidyltransferase family protein [Candidatus Binataceae bacterium]